MKLDIMRILRSYKSLLIAGLLIVVGALALFIPSAIVVSASSSPQAQQLDKIFRKHKVLKLDRALLARQAKQSRRIPIATPDESFELALTPHDMRAANYHAEETVDGGIRRRLERAPVNTYRGKAHGLNEAEARFTIDEDNFEGVIITRDDFHIIEPARKYAPASDPSDFVFYKASDVIAEAGSCAATLDKEISQTGERVLSEESLSKLASAEAFSATVDTELATEADYEFVTAFGGSTGANNEILSIMNQVEGVYQTQLGITFTISIGSQHTWNTASDPYSATDSLAVLNEFTNYWNANFSGYGRDLAHMWTGKDMDGSTIGRAWIGVVCRNPSLAYGVSQRWPSSPSKFVLTAHEIGHNFGGRHPDQLGRTDCGSTIMESIIRTGLTFCPYSVDEITLYANANSSCLAAGTTTTAKAQITSPASGSTFQSSNVTFNWGPVSNGVSYYLDLNSSPGSRDIFANYVTGGSTIVSGIPLDGRTVYVRLWSYIGGVWLYNEYTYKAASGSGGAKAAITSPADGSTFQSSSVTFNWGPVTNSISYYLELNSSPGSRDIFANFVTGGSTTVGGIPADGRNVYVRLWSYIGGVWQYYDYLYKASSGGGGLAQITSPVNDSTFSATTITFNWNPAAGASQYYLDLNSSPGSRDIYANYVSGGSTTVAGIPNDGRIIYVRMWSLIGTAWLYNSYIYKACNGCGGINAGIAQITSPSNGSSFTSSSATFTWNPVAGASEYYLDLNSSPGSRDIFANYVTGGSTIVSGIPLDGRTVYVRLWTNIGGVWLYNAYTYTARS